LFRAHLLGRFEAAAYVFLVLGAVGDWASTTMGLRSGLAEGNALAAALMGTSQWVPVNILLVATIIIVPYVVNRVTRSKAARLLIAFPMLAGIIKIGVSLWNLNLIM
jgi:hypothetical protein